MTMFQFLSKGTILIIKNATEHSYFTTYTKFDLYFFRLFLTFSCRVCKKVLLSSFYLVLNETQPSPVKTNAVLRENKVLKQPIKLSEKK